MASFLRNLSCSARGGAVAAVVAFMAVLLADDGQVHAQVNLIPDSVTACIVDDDEMQITFDTAIEGPTALSGAAFDVRVTVTPTSGAAYSFTERLTIGCLAGRVGRACQRVGNMCVGECPCLPNGSGGKRTPVVQRCVPFGNVCRCVAVKSNKKTVARPTSLGASSTFTLTLDVDVNVEVAESNEGDNSLTSATLNEGTLPLCEAGACCDDGGACTDDLFESDCLEGGGRYLGDLTSCAEDACPDVGACCTPCGGCIPFQTEEECECLEGVWLGPASVCLGDGNNDGVDDACPELVPAASEWSLSLMLVLILGGGAVVFSRRRAGGQAASG